MAITNWSDADRLFVAGMSAILRGASTTFFMEQNAEKWGAEFNGVDGVVLRNYVPTGLQSISGSTATIVDATTQATSYILSQKRALVKGINKMQNMNQNYALSVARIVSDETKGGIIPEVDAYRWNAIYKQAPEANVTFSQDLDAEGADVYAIVKKTASKLRGQIGTGVPIVCAIRTTYWDMITDSPKCKSVQQLTQEGLTTEVYKLNNVYFIPVGDDLMGTKFTANATGFEVTGNLNFVMLPMISAFACIKATKDSNGDSFAYIHNVAGSTNAVVQAFFNHDGFVLKEHEKYIYCSVKETKEAAPKSLSVEPTVQPTAPVQQAPQGMQVLGQK